MPKLRGAPVSAPSQFRPRCSLVWRTGRQAPTQKTRLPVGSAPPERGPRESNQLRAQRRAAHRLPIGAASRAWKAVSRARKQELRAWLQHNIHRASQMDWRAKRTLDNHQARQGWEHHLLDDVRWQHNLHKHFSGIFHKAPMERTRARLPSRGHASNVPGNPFHFSKQELELGGHRC